MNNIFGEEGKRRKLGIGMAVAGIPFFLGGIYMQFTMEGFLYFIPYGVAAILFFQGLAFIFEKLGGDSKPTEQVIPSNGSLAEQKVPTKTPPVN